MLYNKTRKAVVCRKTVFAGSFFKKMKGLIGEKNEIFEYAMVFELEKETRLGAGIHMLFMSVPIDVLWLDSGKKAVDFRKNLKPWSLNISPKKKAKYIIELKKGTIEKKKIGIGNVLSF